MTLSPTASQLQQLADMKAECAVFRKRIDALIRDWHTKVSLVLMRSAGPSPEMAAHIVDLSLPRMRRIRRFFMAGKLRRLRRLVRRRELSRALRDVQHDRRGCSTPPLRAPAPIWPASSAW